MTELEVARNRFGMFVMQGTYGVNVMLVFKN